MSPSAFSLPAGRLHDTRVRTALFWLDPATATIQQIAALPSGGETYPGLVYHKCIIYFSFYSTREGQSRHLLRRNKLP